MRLIENNPNELIRNFLGKLESGTPQDKMLAEQIDESVWDKNHQQEYWSENGQKLSADRDSFIVYDLRYLILTTWVMVAVFLFEDLLEVSFLSYVLNAVPVLFLVIITFTGRLPKLHGQKILWV